MAGQQQSDEDAITDINVTPLVDVSLVLVIIFMAIAPFGLQSGISVLQSKTAASVGKVSAGENVAVRLSKDGKLTLNGKATSFEALLGDLQGALSASKDRLCTVSADDENKVGDVVVVLDTAKQAGALKLAILRTETVPAGEPG